MIWNCDGKIKEITFEYSSVFEEYKCCLNGDSYAWETGASNAGPWDWYRKGYNLEYDEWV